MQSMKTTVVTPPAIEPLTIAEAKQHLVIAASDTAHDDELNRLIKKAREQWEHDTDSVVLSTTLQYIIPGFSDLVRLPRRPLQSITSVVYRDTTSTNQTLSTSIYEADYAESAMRIKYNQVWPTTLDHWNAVTITYVAGYSDPIYVPEIYKHAMLLLVGHYFENKDMIISDSTSSMKAYERLVAKFMRSSYP